MEGDNGSSRAVIGFVCGVLLAAVVGGVVWAQSRSSNPVGDAAPVTAAPAAGEPSVTAPDDPPLSACQAAARWVSLASPGSQSESERQAWADLEAEMVVVQNPVAINALSDMVAAYNRGLDALNAAMAANTAEQSAASARNQQALNEYAERVYSGESGVPLPEHEPLPMPDTSGIVSAKTVAAAEMNEALARFTAECQ